MCGIREFYLIRAQRGIHALTVLYNDPCTTLWYAALWCAHPIHNVYYVFVVRTLISAVGSFCIGNISKWCIRVKDREIIVSMEITCLTAVLYRYSAKLIITENRTLPFLFTFFIIPSLLGFQPPTHSSNKTFLTFYSFHYVIILINITHMSMNPKVRYSPD